MAIALGKKIRKKFKNTETEQNHSSLKYRKAWEADKISEKWAESAWAKRMVMKQRRQGLNDFDRFKLYKAKSARNKILAKAVNIKKNKLSKAGKL